MSHGDPRKPAAPPAVPSSQSYKLERYKFILQQLHALNENLHKYITLFQTLATAIIAAGAAVFVSWKKLDVTAAVAAAAIEWLLILLALLAFFVVLSIVMGMFSWYDYRREEADLLDAEVGKAFRKRPAWKNLWRWYETYAVVFVVALTIATIAAALLLVIPKIV